MLLLFVMQDNLAKVLMTTWCSSFEISAKYSYIGMFDGEGLPTKFWVQQGFRAASYDKDFMAGGAKPNGMNFNGDAGFVMLGCVGNIPFYTFKWAKRLVLSSCKDCDIPDSVWDPKCYCKLGA